jgi:hypothetical protein
MHLKLEYLFWDIWCRTTCMIRELSRAFKNIAEGRDFDMPDVKQCVSEILYRAPTQVPE